MPDRPESETSSGIKELFDELLGEIRQRGRDSLKDYLDVHRVIVEDYGKYIEEELEHDNQVLKAAARFLAEHTALVLQASRTHRTNVRAIHGRLVDAHLKFVEHLKDELDKDHPPPHPPPPAPPPPAPPPPPPPPPAPTARNRGARRKGGGKGR
jgi:hypothetical protein